MKYVKKGGLSPRVEQAGLSSLDHRPIQQAQEFIAEVTEFLQRNLKKTSEEIKKVVSEKNFSVELKHYCNECEYITSNLQQTLAI